MSSGGKYPRARQSRAAPDAELGGYALQRRRGSDSPDCSDPTRAGRRARALEAVGELFSRTGSRRKVLVWFVTDMGVSPLDPNGNREAQFAGLQRLLGGDVTVYAIDPRENFAPTTGTAGWDDGSTHGRPHARRHVRHAVRRARRLDDGAEHRRHGRRASQPADPRDRRPLDPEREQRRKARPPRSSRRTCRRTCWPTSRGRRRSRDVTRSR